MDRNSLLRGMEVKKMLFGLFFSFGNRLQTAGDTFYEEITCKQFFLLICLSLFQDETPTIKELAEVMGSSHQNVKQIVDKLEKIGFVNISYDKEDRRKIRINPTEKMQVLSEKYSAREDEFMKRLYAGVTEEEAAFTLQVMSQIEENLIAIKADKDAQK